MLKAATKIIINIGLLIILTSCSFISSQDGEELPDLPENVEENLLTDQTIIPPTPEPPTPTPENTPTPVPPPGICDRTPGVQEAIINRLEIIYCAQIDDFELNRVDWLKVETPDMEPDDLTSMPHLTDLELTGIHFTLEPNFFREAPGLTSLKINSTSPRIADRRILSPGVFRDLTSLETLEINIERGWTEITINEQVLDGLSELKVIEVESVELVSPEAFAHMNKLQVIELKGVNLPQIPRELLRNLKELREVRITGFKWPNGIILPNFELACLALTGELEPSMKETVHAVTVNQKKVELQDFTDDSEKKIRNCRLIVGDVQIMKVKASLPDRESE